MVWLTLCYHQRETLVCQTCSPWSSLKFHCLCRQGTAFHQPEACRGLHPNSTHLQISKKKKKKKKIVYHRSHPITYHGMHAYCQEWHLFTHGECLKLPNIFWSFRIPLGTFVLTWHYRRKGLSDFQKKKNTNKILWIRFEHLGTTVESGKNVTFFEQLFCFYQLVLVVWNTFGAKFKLPFISWVKQNWHFLWKWRKKLPFPHFGGLLGETGVREKSFLRSRVQPGLARLASFYSITVPLVQFFRCSPCLPWQRWLIHVR